MEINRNDNPDKIWLIGCYDGTSDTFKIVNEFRSLDEDDEEANSGSVINACMEALI